MRQHNNSKFGMTNCCAKRKKRRHVWKLCDAVLKRWKVAHRPMQAMGNVTRGEYELLQRENAELRAAINREGLEEGLEMIRHDVENDEDYRRRGLC